MIAEFLFSRLPGENLEYRPDVIGDMREEQSVEIIYVDIETTAWFDAPDIAHLARWQQLARLPWGVAVTWSQDRGWCEWSAEETPALWDWMIQPDTQIVTWNGDEFDLPRIAIEARIHAEYQLIPELDHIDSFDLMAWIIKETKARDKKGRWYKLDTIAEMNLRRGKTADGKLAATWLASGDPAQRQQAIDYCKTDVQLLIDLHQMLLNGNSLLCPARPDRREYTDILLSLTGTESARYATERAASVDGGNQ